MQTRLDKLGAATGAAGDAAPSKVVFIASSSFSGSTLLGLVLGADRSALFVGEPNQLMRPLGRGSRTGEDQRVCTCGESLATCAFWTAVRDRYGSSVDLNPAPGFSLVNLRLMLRMLSPRPMRRASAPMPYASLLNAIATVGHNERDGLKLIIDASKSIHSLDALARSPDIDLLVVHLIRDCSAVADSFKDRGSSGLHGILAWGLVNVFLKLYAWRRRMRLTAVRYETLCRSPERELMRLNRFLGTSLAANRVAERIREGSFHLFSGNRRVRQWVREFPGIEYRGERGHLSRLERFAAKGMQTVVFGLLRVPPARRQ